MCPVGCFYLCLLERIPVLTFKKTNLVLFLTAILMIVSRRKERKGEVEERGRETDRQR